MEFIFRITLFIAGIINFLPLLVAFSPSKTKAAYGITLEDRNVELLLRHRAVLFGIVGGLMVYSAIFQTFYTLAMIVGAVSMASYLLLFYTIGNINAPLTKVMKIDLFALLVLLLGCFLYVFG